MEGHDPYAKDHDAPASVRPGEIHVLMQSTMAAPCILRIKTAAGDVGLAPATQQAADKKADVKKAGDKKAGEHHIRLPDDRADALAAIKPFAARQMPIFLIADRPRPTDRCLDQVNRLATDAGFTAVAHIY